MRDTTTLLRKDVHNWWGDCNRFVQNSPPDGNAGGKGFFRLTAQVHQISMLLTPDGAMSNVFHTLPGREFPQRTGLSSADQISMLSYQNWAGTLYFQLLGRIPAGQRHMNLVGNCLYLYAKCLLKNVLQRMDFQLLYYIICRARIEGI